VDDVGTHGGGEAVGDDDDGATRGQQAEPVQPVLFGPRVHGAGRLVQEQDGRLAAKRARQRDALPFAAAEFRPARKPLAEQVLIALREPGDDLVRPAARAAAWTSEGVASGDPTAMFSPAVAL
jgi:hypothetical protein